MRHDNSWNFIKRPMERMVNTKGTLSFMMKCAFYFICIFTGTAAHAQSNCTVSVVDGDGNPLKKLPIKVISGKENFILQTNGKGCVSIPLDSCKQIRIVIDCKLYANVDTILNTTTSPHSIRLSPAIQEIEQVNIVAHKRIAKNSAEKSVYTIDMSKMLKTTKAKNALRFLPGIETTGDDYSIIGRGGIARVKIDGVPASDLDLKALNASEIKEIEVREYTKDGDNQSMGEINIIRKPNKERKLYGFLQIGGGGGWPMGYGYTNIKYVRFVVP